MSSPRPPRRPAIDFPLWTVANARSIDAGTLPNGLRTLAVPDGIAVALFTNLELAERCLTYWEDDQSRPVQIDSPGTLTDLLVSMPDNGVEFARFNPVGGDQEWQVGIVSFLAEINRQPDSDGD